MQIIAVLDWNKQRELTERPSKSVRGATDPEMMGAQLRRRHGRHADRSRDDRNLRAVHRVSSHLRNAAHRSLLHGLGGPLQAAITFVQEIAHPPGPNGHKPLK